MEEKEYPKISNEVILPTVHLTISVQEEKEQ